MTINNIIALGIRESGKSYRGSRAGQDYFIAFTQLYQNINRPWKHPTTGQFIKPVKKVQNLGFFMDCLMKNGFHINKITVQTFITLWNIKDIRRYLNRDTTKAIIQTLVMSKIDYCNSLLDGSAQIQKIQRTQNMACWVICNLNKHDHITDSMKDLHWLRVPERIKYKIAVIMFKIENLRKCTRISYWAYPDEDA